MEEVQKKITEACKKSRTEPGGSYPDCGQRDQNGRNAFRNLPDLGERNFGENKVQELTEKRGSAAKDIHWHMIGHLQRNKVKYIAGKVALIHSVDSLRLAKTISEEAVKHNCEIPLIEVNVAGEESKFGVSVEAKLH